MRVDDYGDTLGAGSYPEPDVEREKSITGTIVLTYDLDCEVPASWDRDEIIEDIKEHLDDYIYIKDIEEIEVDI